jgi:hypothetical protein
MNEKIKINYALQMCDVRSYQGNKRFCTDDRTELSKKSLVSFLNSINFCINKEPKTFHEVKIFADDCSDELKTYIDNCVEKNISEQLSIEIEHLNKAGIANSIQYCYKWLKDNGSNLVYQVQDDYIFTEPAIYHSIDMFYQLYQNYNTHPIICPYIDPDFMRNYKGRSVPRLIELGRHSYWCQVYDTSCSFLTSHNQFIQHLDLYDVFYDLIRKKIINGNIIDLENKSLNYMFTQRGVLGVTPINGLTFHMQTDSEKDPYIDWKPIWDSIIL